MTVNTLSVYDLNIALLDDAGQSLASWPQVDVLGARYHSGGAVQGIFGRDLLASCLFLYDGKNGTFALTV